MRMTWALLPPALVLAAGQASAAGIAAGQARAEACQAGHGAQGVPGNPAIPALAGRRDEFLQWQLVFLRSGRRANEIMGPMAAEAVIPAPCDASEIVP